MARLLLTAQGVGRLGRARLASAKGPIRGTQHSYDRGAGHIHDALMMTMRLFGTG